jgi:hypothetical protein
MVSQTVSLDRPPRVATYYKYDHWDFKKYLRYSFILHNFEKSVRFNTQVLSENVASGDEKIHDFS